VFPSNTSLPPRGAWIETHHILYSSTLKDVAPPAGGVD
jgi:hypothetical protein